MRLFQGKKNTEKVYFQDPVNALEFWIEKKASRLHIIDLDGAWGSSENQKLIHNLIKRANNRIRIQIGGGIRSIKQAHDLINMGIDRVIIGTMAVRDPKKVAELSDLIGRDHLIVAVDYIGDYIATEGWLKKNQINPFTYAKEMENLKAGYLLFSSINSDGTFHGPDYSNIKKVLKCVSLPIIYAGGIRSMNDINLLSKLNLNAVVIGKAFYEEKIPLSIFKQKRK